MSPNTRLYNEPKGRRPFHFFITDGGAKAAEAAVQIVWHTLPIDGELFHLPLESVMQRRSDSRGLPFLEVDIRVLYVTRALGSYDAVALTGRPANLVRWFRELARMDQRRLNIHLQTPLARFPIPKGFNGFRLRSQVIEALEAHELSYTTFNLGEENDPS